MSALFGGGSLPLLSDTQLSTCKKVVNGQTQVGRRNKDEAVGRVEEREVGAVLLE